MSCMSSDVACARFRAQCHHTVLGDTASLSPTLGSLQPSPFANVQHCGFDSCAFAPQRAMQSHTAVQHPSCCRLPCRLLKGSSQAWSSWIGSCAARRQSRPSPPASNKYSSSCSCSWTRHSRTSSDVHCRQLCSQQSTAVPTTAAAAASLFTTVTAATRPACLQRPDLPQHPSVLQMCCHADTLKCSTCSCQLTSCTAAASCPGHPPSTRHDAVLPPKSSC